MGLAFGWLELRARLLCSSRERKRSVGENLASNNSKVVYEDAEIFVGEKQAANGAQALVRCSMVSGRLECRIELIVLAEASALAFAVEA